MFTPPQFLKKFACKPLGITALAFGMILPTTLPTFAAPLSDEQTQAVKALIRTTLVENPEILSEAMSALQAKKQNELQERQKAIISANSKALYHSDDPYFGAEKPKIHIIEFFDYNCGYCRLAFPDIMKVIKSENDTQVIFKELPVLGPESVAVSQLALAAREQKKYNEYHTALMKSEDRLTEESALKIAKDIGLDIPKLKKDAAGKNVKSTLTSNTMLAGMLGIRGTPTFIVGDTLIPGKIDAAILKQAIAKTRKDAEIKK